MYPHERALVNELEDEPFALIGVNSDRTVEIAKQAVEKNNLNWRSFQNQPAGAPKSISQEWNVRGWPTLVIIDKDMRIRYRGHNGMEATKVAKSLLAEMKAEAG